MTATLFSRLRVSSPRPPRLPPWLMSARRRSRVITLRLGAAEVQTTDCNADNATGRYIVPFTNEFNGTNFRYLRLYTIVTGTIATGINYKAYASVAK